MPRSCGQNSRSATAMRTASAPALTAVRLVQIGSDGVRSEGVPASLVRSIIGALFPVAADEAQRDLRPLARRLAVGPPGIHQYAVRERDGAVGRRLNRVTHVREHADSPCSFRAEGPEVLR